MGFYLRKHFNVGPLRINLSKSGVGLSAGVTGARVGLNKRGVYVHGGREGVYYRKQLDTSGTGASPANAVPGQQALPDDGKVDLYTDTEAAYPPAVPLDDVEPPSVMFPALPSLSPRLGYTLGGGLAGTGLSAFTAPALAPFVMLLVLAEAARFAWTRRRRNRDARQTWQTAHEALTTNNDPQPLLDALNTSLPTAQQRWLHARGYALLLDRLLEDSDAVDAQVVRRFEAEATLSDKLAHTLKHAVFAELVDAVVEDHVLTESEEQAVTTLARRLTLNDDAIAAERAVLQALRTKRKVDAAPLTPVDCDVSLKQGETCYYQTPARFLVERVQERFQRDNVKYTVRGLEVDMEGMLYLTERRVLLVGNGTRSYRLHRVLDEELVLHDNTLRLTLDERVSQVIVSTPDTHVLAAHLTNVLDAHHEGA